MMKNEEVLSKNLYFRGRSALKKAKTIISRWEKTKGRGSFYE